MNLNKQITVVIPNKVGQTPELTMRSLYMQNFTEFDIVVINDHSGNANNARNAGLRMVHTPYVLFSDNDINWHPQALLWMFSFLEYHKDLSYCWGSYELDGKTYCNRTWNGEELKRHNYISTMSLVRSLDHPGFDPKIKRLQDWDVWLTMLEAGKRGEYIDKMTFVTPVRNGITRVGISWEEAVRDIREKHGKILES